MRKNLILLILLVISFTVPSNSLAAKKQETLMDWQWLVDQVAAGTQTITLPNDIRSDGETPLSAEGTVRIEGNGFGLTGVQIDQGTFIFKDVRLSGIHGVGEENGGDALTLQGEGAIAVLMGTTRAEGGRSGLEGETGGDGIQLLGKGQGLILNGTATASGGIGRIGGGMGVRVTGCGANILATDSAAMVGSLGLVEGGSGLHTPACCKITLEAQASATGGNAQYTAGNGLASLPCAKGCGAVSPIAIGDMAMAIGGIGQTGGHGILAQRGEASGQTDLTLQGTCMLIGGDGETNGSAVSATHLTLAYEGTPQAIGGRYFATESPAMLLEDCTITGDEAALTVAESAKTETYPASGISSIITAALSQRSDRYTPEIIEDGLAAQATETKLNGFTVDKGRTSQAKVSGNGLKIFMYNATLETRMQFQQRLMADGAEGTRLVLIGSVSGEWPTLDATPAAIRKLQSIGITQLAYTTVAPSYHDRILDIAALVEAIDAYEAANETEIAKLLCGTADDAVIFVLGDKSRDYQEELMPEIVRPME